MKKSFSIAIKRGVFLLSIICFASAIALAQNDAARKSRARTGAQTTTTSTATATKPQQTTQNRPTPGAQKISQKQDLTPIEISGTLKTLRKSDFMTFCNIPMNLPIDFFGDMMEDADFDYDDELTENMFISGYPLVEVYTGIFPAMPVTVYVHFNKDKAVYRVEIQTKPNTDDNTRALFNNWHNRLQVYIDGGKDDNVDDPMAFSQSGPGIYNLTFFPSENSEDPVKGWILLKIRYKDKSAPDYDENHSSFITVDYIDYYNAPAEYKQSSN